MPKRADEAGSISYLLSFQGGVAHAEDLAYEKRMLAEWLRARLKKGNPVLR